MSSKTCVIVSGIPGSGKSTLIRTKQWAEYGTICSADQFFIKGNDYKFDATKLGDAHSWCLRVFIEAARGMREVIVVDNTNLSTEEIAPYYSVAKAYGYEVKLITLQVDVDVAAGRNVHGVPKNSIERMSSKLKQRQLPGFWKMSSENYLWDAEKSEYQLK